MLAIHRAKPPLRGAKRSPGRTGSGIRWAILLLVAAWTIAVFSPSLRNEFVDWDDYQNLRDNEHIRSFSPENVKWMLTAAHLGVWQPVSWIVTAAEYALFGGDDRSFSRGMHGANVALHALASVLLLVVIRRLLARAFEKEGGRPGVTLDIAAAMSAILFAVHPLRAELVAWATAQPYILAVIFTLASVYFYLGYADSGRRTPLVLSWLFFALSLLSKSIGVPLVAVLFLLDAYPLRRLSPAGTPGIKRIVVEKIPYALLAAAVVIIAPLAKGSAESTMSLAVHGPLQRAAQACYGLVFYVWKTAIPTGLSPIYELRLPFPMGEPKYLVSIALVIAAASISILLVRSKRYAVPVVLFSYALLLGPVLGFLQSGNQEVADRYAYLPVLALHALLGGLFYRLLRNKNTAARLGGAGVFALAAVLSVLTVRQCAVWESTSSLWTRAAALQPHSSVAQNGYGYVLLESGNTDEAIGRFRRAIAVKGDNEMAHRNLWTAYRTAGRSDELIVALRESIRFMPDFAEAYHHLGNAHARRKEYEPAATAFRRALEIDPNLALSHRSLGGVLYSMGDRTGAERHARTALDLDPTLADARTVLASCLRDENRRDDARALLREGLRLDPGNETLRRALERLGR